MEKLDQKYKVELDSIGGAIQSSNLLSTYLDDEEEDSYQALREEFEPQIEAVYVKVASENPLQLISFEQDLLDPSFEGLYLSKILGYAALRGEIDENYRYKRPQDHFKDILLAICVSPNFDVIRTRIGQGVQVAFGFSSGIWITNLIEQVEGKRVKSFLRAQVLPKYRDLKYRKQAYESYARQFGSLNYQSAEFPRTVGELKVLSSSLLAFIKYRIGIAANNDSLIPNIKDFLTNESFQNGPEFVGMIHLFANFFDSDDRDSWLAEVFNNGRKSYDQFNEEYFSFHESILNGDLNVDAAVDARVTRMLDTSIKDDLLEYYQLMDGIHTKGYVHDDSIESIRKFYDKHEGLSTINECLRRSIYGYFRRLIENLSTDAYQDFFEIHKIYAVYFQIFNNQQFVQDAKGLSLDYIRKLLKQYTDKRGRDYQDIKKFVAHTYVDLGFLTEKQIVELFKTRRKKKTA